MRPSSTRAGRSHRGILAGFLVVLFGAAGATAAPLFPNPGYATGPNPYGLVLADFDGDGIQDLMVSDYGYSMDVPGGLSLFKGLPDGTFAGEIRIATSFGPAGLLAGDFNRDGLPDVVFWSINSATAVLLLNKGNMTFGPESTLPMDLFPEKILPGDFDGDGGPDLLAYGGSGSGVLLQVLFGSGHGTFTSAPAFSPGDLQDVEVADADGDGKTDILLTTADYPGPNQVRVLGGNGDGTFRLLSTVATGDYLTEIFPADLNGDGREDFATSSLVVGPQGGSPGPFSIFYGRGDGFFDAGPSESTGQATSDLAVGDFNRDGVPDFAETTSYDLILVRIGNGDGSFTAAPDISAGVNDVRVLTHDFNRDGKADLALLANWPEAVLTFFGNGDGTFGPRPIEALQNSLLAGAAVGDFNGDGRPDLAAGDVSRDEVSVLLGNGDGTFGAEARFPAGVGPSAVATGDFNGDGRLDIAVAALNWHEFPPQPLPNGSLSILLGNGDGTFQPPTTYGTGVNPVQISTADFDGDGHMDLLVLSNNGAFVVASFADLFLGNGDGTFRAGNPVAVGALASGIAVADFDGDGHPDLALSTHGHYSNDYPYPHLDGGVSILMGLGDGTFLAATPLGSVIDASSVAAQDLNGDGRPDLAVADTGTGLPDGRGGVVEYLGAGGGSFIPGGIFTAGVGPLSVRIGDFDGDGIQDLATANNGGDESVLLGSGGGAFHAELRFGLFGSALFLTDADFNGDGSLDSLVLSSAGAFVLQGRAPALLTKVSGLTLTFPGPGEKRSGVLTWTTDRETGLRGFNAVLLNPAGQRVQLNPGPIACLECDTGEGHDYAYRIPNMRSGKNVFLEVLHANGSVDTFGPAMIRRQHGGPQGKPVTRPELPGDSDPGTPKRPGGTRLR